jgi:2-methylisocitrate lyase-like PEP mutase family enzyme
VSRADKVAAFRALHEGEPFVIPNPWDPGSARVLDGLGFPALATTSSGFAFTLGRNDGDVTLDEVIDHATAIDAATTLPVSVDLENGYGDEPAEAARAVEAAAAAGAAGGSIEDYAPRGPLAGIYERELAVERVVAAVEAAANAPGGFVLTARAENQIRDGAGLADTIERLQAYEAAGADVLYAPGLRTIEEVREVCGTVAKPVNVLATPKLSAAEIFEAGAQRISVGGALAFTAVAAFAEAATAIRDEGTFAGCMRPPRELTDWLS